MWHRTRIDLLVATKLAEPGECNVQHESVPGRSCLDKHREVQQIRLASIIPRLNVADHLLHLQINKWVIFFSVHVILDDDAPCLFVAVLRNKPRIKSVIVHLHGVRSS